jgi:hypothetical protein
LTIYLQSLCQSVGKNDDSSRFQGRLAEFGPPSRLLSSNGIFAAMAAAAGIIGAKQ